MTFHFNKFFFSNLLFDIRTYLNRNINPDDITRKCIDKQLKPFKVDYDFVLRNPRIDGISWYNVYYFKSEKEYQDWKKYCLKQFKRYYFWMNKAALERKFQWFDLMWGIKRIYE